MAIEDILNQDNIEKLSEGFSRYVVAPAQSFGIAGFVFDVEDETTQESVNEITDHYIEDNSTVQDHVAVRPEKLTLRGFVGELVTTPDDFLAQTQRLIERLTPIAGFSPELTTGASIAKNELASQNEVDFFTAGNETADLYSTIKNFNPTANRQQRAYLFFKSAKEQRIPLSVQTPFEYLTNMYIESVVATQSGGTNDMSTFEITLKQVRTVALQFEDFDFSNYQGRTGLQRESEDKKGKAQGVERSLLLDTLGKIF